MLIDNPKLLRTSESLPCLIVDRFCETQVECSPKTVPYVMRVSRATDLLHFSDPTMVRKTEGSHNIMILLLLSTFLQSRTVSIVFGTGIALFHFDSRERDFAATVAAAIVNFDR